MYDRPSKVLVERMDPADRRSPLSMRGTVLIGLIRILTTLLVPVVLCLVGCNADPNTGMGSGALAENDAAMNNGQLVVGESGMTNSSPAMKVLDMRSHYSWVFRLAEEYSGAMHVRPIGVRSYSDEPGMYIVDFAIIGDSEAAAEIAFDLSRGMRGNADAFLDVICDRWRPLESSRPPGVSPRGGKPAAAAMNSWRISPQHILIIEPCGFYAEGDPCEIISLRFKPRSERVSGFESINLDPDSIFDTDWHEFAVFTMRSSS